MRPQFLITPAPYMNESLRGFIQRVAERNNYEAPRWVYEYCKLGNGNALNNLLLVKPTVHSLELLGYMVNQDVNKLRNMTLYQEFGCFFESHSIEINTLYQFGISVHSTKICPLCIQDENFIHKVWDVNVFTCCP